MCEPWDSQGNEKMQFLFLLLFALTFLSEMKYNFRGMQNKKPFDNTACRASYKPSKLEGQSEIELSFLRV